jgi:fructose-bisphosphate aldolase class I
MGKRLEAFGVKDTKENRRKFREILITTPGVEQFLSGIILFDETIRQSDSNGKKFTDILKEKGILIGIKVDQGTVPMPDSPEEVTTKGLDGLAERLAEYKQMGAVFTKWRSVIRIGSSIPSKRCLEANADGLAQYASIVQKAGLVPILEPEVLLDGGHTLHQAEKVTTETLKTVFAACKKQKVDLTGLLLKSSMVLPGNTSGQDASPEEIAQATISCFKKSVPKSVPGIVFLSGGQTPEQASENLFEICNLEKEPWQMTFSFSRALEEPVLEAWHGNDDDIDAAQEIFYNLCRRNSEARMGKL